ncbi:ATP-binding protein [Thalassotalea fusca]
MLDVLDIPTLWIMSVFSMLFCTVIMFFIWYLNIKIAGSFAWFMGMLSFSACLVLLTVFSLAGHANSDLLSLLVKECTLVGYIFILLGTRQFFSFHRYNKIIFYSLLVSFSTLLIVFKMWLMNESFALALMSIASISIFGWSFITILQGYINSPASERVLTGSIFLGFVLLATIPKDIYQILLVLSEPLQSQFVPSLLNILLAFYAIYLPMVLLVSFAILCNERKENSLKKLHQQSKEHVAQRSRFLATMSHEIRTPLNGIMGIAQLMQASHNEPDIQNDCQTIVHSAELLSELANNVLEYSKLDYSDIPLEESDTDLSQCLNEIILLTEPLAQSKSINLLIEPSKKLNQYYFFDNNKLRQILLNLVGNAIKFTHQGEVTLKVELIKRNLPTRGNENEMTSDSLLFSVRDTGIGIPVEEQENILEPFRQASNSACQYPGSGLGLAISDKLLKLMGSSLQFSSELYIGSCFYFQLTLPHGDAELARLNESIASSAIQNTSEITGLNVLLIEDLPLIQFVAINLLAQDKHKVTLASEILQAIALVGETKFDIIFTDINLPDGNGIELSHLVRNGNSLNKDTPIVAMTARVSKVDLQTYHQAGMYYCATKPIKLSQLQSVIKQALGLYDTSNLNCFANANESEVKKHSSAEFMQYFNSQLSVFNPKILESLVETIESAVFQQLIEQLEPQLEQFWQQVLTARNCNELRTVREALHKCAGTAAQLGFEQLTDACSQLEKLTDLRLRQEFVVDNQVSKQLDALIELSLHQLNDYKVHLTSKQRYYGNMANRELKKHVGPTFHTR